MRYSCVDATSSLKIHLLIGNLLLNILQCESILRSSIFMTGGYNKLS